MKIIAYFSVVLFIFLFVAGCTDPYAPVKSETLDVIASQEGDVVYIQYGGGADAKNLASLNLEITPSDGRTFSQPLGLPKTESRFQFSGWGTSGKDYVKVTAVFKNKGTETVLFTAV